MAEKKSEKKNVREENAGEVSESRLMKVIRERRSVRNYDPDRPVEDEKLAALLEAARLAPSSNNTQPWRFVVVKDEDTRDRISRAAPLGAGPCKWMKNAPVIIACCGRQSALYHKSAGQIFDKDFFKIDIAIAIEHIVLEAKELGLGTCWVGWFDERKVRSILRIPSDTRVIVLLPVGYPKGEWPVAKKRKKMDEIVSYGKFGNKIPLSSEHIAKIDFQGLAASKTSVFPCDIIFCSAVACGKSSEGCFLGIRNSGLFFSSNNKRYESCGIVT